MGTGSCHSQQGRDLAPRVHSYVAVLGELNVVLEGLWCGQGQGTDLCYEGVVCVVP